MSRHRKAHAQFARYFQQSRDDDGQRDIRHPTIIGTIVAGGMHRRRNEECGENYKNHQLAVPDVGYAPGFHDKQHGNEKEQKRAVIEQRFGIEQPNGVAEETGQQVFGAEESPKSMYFREWASPCPARVKGRTISANCRHTPK